jgi:hypothetical protein
MGPAAPEELLIVRCTTLEANLRRDRETRTDTFRMNPVSLLALGAD